MTDNPIDGAENAAGAREQESSDDGGAGPDREASPPR